MKKTIMLIVWFLVIVSGAVAADISFSLQNAVGEVSAIVKLKDRAALNKTIGDPETAGGFPSAHARVIEALRSNSRRSQAEILQIIESAGEKIVEHKSFWISNCIYIRGEAAFIRELAAHPDVEYVAENPEILLVEPVDSGKTVCSISTAEPGLCDIGARTAWSMGLKGAGRIVCNFDTGVNGNHPALSARWRGANGAPAAACWFDPYTNTTFPIDNHGHGTHTMGTITGMDGADTVGVAFEAQWIAAGVVDRGGGFSRTVADILAAFQWAVDPDGDPQTLDDVPDVINNSWGVPAGYLGGCDQTFWEAIDNVEAAGVVCLFAAGNEGPYARTIRTPADRIASPFNCLAVGALNGATGQIANFSSRGPSGCDSSTIKPELTAPGVGIRSCDRNGGYRTMSGTSMATPHVAGAVALLRQFNPQASVNQVKAALLYGADDLGSPGDDNDYGHGKLNLLRSLYNMPPPANPFIHVISCRTFDDRDDRPEPGESLRLRLILENIGSTGQVQATLTSANYHAQIIDNLLNLGERARFDTLRIDGFRINISEAAVPGETLRFQLQFANGSWHQSFAFEAVVIDGQAEAVATIVTDSLEMSFSNFGQFGLGDGSFNPRGGRGFRYPVGGIDLLKESSLLISLAGRVSDGARNEANIPDNDFKPLANNLPRVETPGIYADYDGYAAYSDSAAEYPLGVGVSQKCFAWNGDHKFVLTEFTISNYGQQPLTGLRAAIYCDWDLPLTSGNDDVVGYIDSLSLGFVMDLPTGHCVGVRPITSPASSYRAIANSLDFADGFPDSRKSQFMGEGFVQISYTTPDNYSHLIGVGPYDIVAGDSEVVAFAFVIGNSLAELAAQAQQAFWMYPNLTEIGDRSRPTPADIGLGRNYPNPFNSSTAIEVRLEAPAELVIYDIKGSRIRTFQLQGGRTETIIWDGRNEAGEEAAAGVYFYKIKGNTSSPPRKMILLK